MSLRKTPKSLQKKMSQVTPRKIPKTLKKRKKMPKMSGSHVGDHVPAELFEGAIWHAEISEKHALRVCWIYCHVPHVSLPSSLLLIVSSDPTRECYRIHTQREHDYTVQFVDF